MYDNANLVITAWDGERLVGILRALTDGAYSAYIADLAVHPDYQRQGVGKQLLDEATSTSSDVSFHLHAAPLAEHYYGHVGWTKSENAWTRPRRDWSRAELFD
jgi:GNAT superfamily N-acetyltransferase